MVKHFRTEKLSGKILQLSPVSVIFLQNQGTTILNHMDFPKKLSIIRRFCGRDAIL